MTATLTTTIKSWMRPMLLACSLFILAIFGLPATSDATLTFDFTCAISANACTGNVDFGTVTWTTVADTNADGFTDVRLDINLSFPVQAVRSRAFG
jgi:type 1 fimbria pilin